MSCSLLVVCLIMRVIRMGQWFLMVKTRACVLPALGFAAANKVDLGMHRTQLLPAISFSSPGDLIRNLHKGDGYCTAGLDSGLSFNGWGK